MSILFLLCFVFFFLFHFREVLSTFISSINDRLQGVSYFKFRAQNKEELEMLQNIHLLSFSVLMFELVDCLS